MGKIIFLHGLDSSSLGTKARFFKDKFPETIVPDFSGSLKNRMNALDLLLHKQDNLTLVGSSFGGLMASIFAIEHPHAVKKVILLAPALNFPEFQDYSSKKTAVPAWLFIGSDDTVTPPIPVQKAAKAAFTHLTIVPLTDDHLLHKTFRKLPWKELLHEESD